MFFSFFGTAANNDVHHHVLTELPITKNGYLYIYVSNETLNIAVFFDNLQVTHIPGPLLEETHFYPFGLTMAGIISKALTGAAENKFKYNGKEEQQHEFTDGSGLEWTDYGARMYDNQIGRWHVIDLMIEKHFNASPYAYVYNNSINFSDQFGLDTILVDRKGRLTSIAGGEKDVIVRVSETERKKGAIKYDKNGNLKKSHIVSQDFEKNSIYLSTQNSGATIETTNEQSEAVFNFLADNTEVEFSLITYTNDGVINNRITTSYSNTDDTFGSNLITRLLEGGNVKLISHTHNHTKDNSSYLSNERTTAVDGASGDLGAYKVWTEKQGVDFKVYFRYNGITREFDVKGNEIKPKKK